MQASRSKTYVKAKHPSLDARAERASESCASNTIQALHQVKSFLISSVSIVEVNGNPVFVHVQCRFAATARVGDWVPPGRQNVLQCIASN